MKCPVCGNNTFPSENYENEVCPECYWEYDLLQVADPDYSGGANCHALNEYRNIYWDLKKKNPEFSCRNTADRQKIIKLDHTHTFYPKHITQPSINDHYEIDDLDLPTRIRNICIRNDILTIAQLRSACNDGTLAKFRGIGTGFIRSIQFKLEYPDKPFPQKEEVVDGHIEQIKALLNRARTENDLDSVYTLQWILSLVYKLKNKE